MTGGLLTITGRDRPGRKEGNRVKIHPLRRAAGRRRARQVRRKLANARRIDADTSAMLARRLPGRNDGR